MTQDKDNALLPDDVLMAVEVVRSQYDWQDTFVPDDYKEAMRVLLSCAEHYYTRAKPKAAPVVPDGWQPIESAPKGKYVILNIAPLNYPVIAARDDEGWMTRTGAFYGVDTADAWMPLPAAPDKRADGGENV